MGAHSSIQTIVMYSAGQSVDGFNMLNRLTILQRNVTRLQLAISNQISELQSPADLRLGARLNF